MLYASILLETRRNVPRRLELIFNLIWYSHTEVWGGMETHNTAFSESHSINIYPEMVFKNHNISNMFQMHSPLSNVMRSPINYYQTEANEICWRSLDVGISVW